LRRRRAEHRLSLAANLVLRVIAAGRCECASALAIGPFRDLRRVGLFCAPHGRSTVPRAEPASIAGTASPRSALPFTAFVAEASQRFRIPANWIWAVMRIESAGDVRPISPKGAMGLMQIMPKTYAGLRARHHLGPDAYNPRDNILAGAAYLRELLDRYGSPGFLAAYNAGPARYDEHLATGRPLPSETQDYVAMLSPMIGDGQSDDRTVASFDLIAWARATLFATHPETPPNVELPAAKVQPDRLPSVRRIVDLSALSPQSEGLFVHLASGDRPQ
jgi:soluble lytic murein transglycosylase-like protein